MTARVLAFAATAVLLLAGCSNPALPAPPAPKVSGDTQDGEVSVITVDANGRTVTCVVWQRLHANAGGGGISCDWAGAK